MSDADLVKMGDLIGSELLDASGAKLAHIREIFMHKGAGVLSYAVVEVGGFLGAGGKYHPVPWRLLRYDTGRNALVLDVDKDRLKSSPAYDRDQLNSVGYGWGEQVDRYFDAPAA